MAQPPDINETFLREVDENLRRDQLRDFCEELWRLADRRASSCSLLASGGFIWWQQHQVQQLGEAGRAARRSLSRTSARARPRKRRKQLDELSKSGSKAVRASALFTRAALALQQNDLKLATAKYREIAGDSGLPQPYRDAALIRQTALEFDQLQPQEVISRLQPLAKPGKPWFGSAGEMTALALIKQGKKARGRAAVRRDRQGQDRSRLHPRPRRPARRHRSASTPAARSRARPSRTNDDQDQEFPHCRA